MHDESSSLMVQKRSILYGCAASALVIGLGTGYFVSRWSYESFMEIAGNHWCIALIAAVMIGLFQTAIITISMFLVFAVVTRRIFRHIFDGTGMQSDES